MLAIQRGSTRRREAGKCRNQKSIRNPGNQETAVQTESDVLRYIRSLNWGLLFAVREHGDTMGRQIISKTVRGQNGAALPARLFWGFPRGRFSVSEAINFRNMALRIL